MRLVIIESPYAGHGKTLIGRLINRWLNVQYARACMKDAFDRGDAPFASHLLYTQRGIFRDGVAEERRKGIDAGLEWGAVAELTAIYIDRGISIGMKYGEIHADRVGRPVEYRSLNKQIDRVLKKAQGSAHDSDSEKSREDTRGREDA